MNTKPGVKTTEFWVTALLALVGPIVTILVGAGVVQPADAEEVTDTVTSNAQAIKDSTLLLTSNLTSLFAVRKYVGARTEVKTGK